MGKLRTKEQKVANKKAREEKESNTPRIPLQKTSHTIKVKLTKVTQTLTRPNEEPKTFQKEFAHSKAKVLSTFRKNQPVTGDFVYNLAKHGKAERTLKDGTHEVIELIEEIKELKI